MLDIGIEELLRRLREASGTIYEEVVGVSRELSTSVRKCNVNGRLRSEMTVAIFKATYVVPEFEAHLRFPSRTAVIIARTLAKQPS